MTWRIGDQGFDIALSSVYVPKIIGSNIRELIGPALAAGGLSLSDVDTWAVHPGGSRSSTRCRGPSGFPPAR